MTARFQRLLLILISLIFITSAVLLILINSKKNLIFFYTPSEFLLSDLEIKKKVRIGGYVLEDSIKKLPNSLYNFIITDNKNFLSITYQGLLPDLFREGQGAIIEGILIENNVIKATSVFAKHDENYMPESLKKELEKNEYWKKDYK
jgi:cytochrome c-type biogenesis protein CcmE